MDKNISEIFDYGDEIVVVEEQENPLDPARIKELTMKKLNTEEMNLRNRKVGTKARQTYRTILIAAVIAVLLIGTGLAVSYSFRSPGLWDYLRVTDEEAAALEETELTSRPQASDTHDGVTVSIEQAVIDGGTAFLSLRVEGLEVPEGRRPIFDGTLVTIDGARADGWGVRIFEDLHWLPEGVMYGDGTPAQKAGNGAYFPHALREDGSFEIDVSLNGLWLTESLVGKKITVTIDRLGTAVISSDIREGETFTAEGPWVLTWTAEGVSESRKWTLSEPLAYGITLTGVQLSPLTLRLTYEYPPLTNRDGHFYNADDQEFPELEPLILYQLVMKDGTEYTGIAGGGTGGPDVGSDELSSSFTYHVDMSLNYVIDPDEAAALVFREVGAGNDPDGGKAVYYTVVLPE